MGKAKNAKAAKSLFLHDRKKAEIDYCNTVLSGMGEETYYLKIKGIDRRKIHKRNNKDKNVVTLIGKKTGAIIAQRKDFDIYRALDNTVHDFMDKVNKMKIGYSFKRLVVKQPKNMAA